MKGGLRDNVQTVTATTTLGIKEFLVQKSMFVFVFLASLVLTADHLSAAPAIKIMALGDSITTGCTDPPAWAFPFTFGYRGPLYTRLVNAGYDFQFVGACSEPWASWPNTPVNGVDLRTVNQDHHRGYPGWRTLGVSSNVVGWLNADNPDVILLMIGTNDMGDIASGKKSLATAKSHLNDLVQKIVDTKPEAKLIVAQIPPVLPYNMFGAMIGEYNAYIKNTLVPSFATEGKHISTVDQYAAFLTNSSDPASIDESLLVDTCHPNQAGYDRMARVWFEGVKAAVPAPEPSTFSLLLSHALCSICIVLPGRLAIPRGTG